MRLFFKSCFRFSMALPETKVYYPVVNIHTQALQYYDPMIVTLLFSLPLLLFISLAIMNIKDSNNKYTNNNVKAQQAKEKIKLKSQSEIEVTPLNIKQFFIDQVKTDMYSMYKQKEIIIVGRSNVGKSSLMNSIFKRKIAKVSKKQGSTKKLFYYELKDNLGYIIDPPGYGFADINVHAKRKWQGMIYDYIQISTRLARVYMLVNAMHGLKKNDLSLLSQIQKQNVNIQIVLTKVDKIPERTLYDTMLSIGMQVKGFTNVHPLIHACSSKNGFGITELQNSIYDSIANFEPRNIDDREEVLLKFLESYRVRPKEYDTFFGKDALKSPKDQQKIGQKPKELPSNGINKRVKLTANSTIKDKGRVQKPKPKEIK